MLVWKCSWSESRAGTSEGEKSAVAMCGEAPAARPRQRGCSSTTEKMGGGSGVYGRHQFRMQNQFLKQMVLSRGGERKARDGMQQKEKWTGCVNGAEDG